MPDMRFAAMSRDRGAQGLADCRHRHDVVEVGAGQYDRRLHPSLRGTIPGC
jgi:hypothetical protein